ncbi:circularly permuted type 2 ATP-grasp protein [Amaricoccus macauensis]|uniref:circularly permuted type 2 ATP-grasp protein n=1 Tax=Amaricoccus macauensis TaxID=57001 RepID=UPI003C7BC9C7
MDATLPLGHDVPSQHLIAEYSRLPGVPDELLDAEGRVRPVWRRFVEHFASLTEEDRAQRIARGEQYLRDAGVFYRQYDLYGSTERAWPLAHVPLLIEESEWERIAAGLRQRADLLELLAADLYGTNQLVAGGHLPASLIARCSEWHRPLVHVTPRSGHYLHFVAFEIGRGPDGQWWVLGDRTQAPSGAGFALENRVATARAYGDFFADAHVHRLAGFFRTFRDTLYSLSPPSENRLAILTPGPLNETYFEHAYIARYLGFALLEGEDLVVEDGKVMVRTVAGFEPVSVLWRRLDSAFADPLELNPESRLGTPGLVSAVRQGSVTLVNALGTGVLETRALMAFLPRISHELLGEPLSMPNIATWWCGQPTERAHVRANLDTMMIGPALSTRLPFETEETTVLGTSIRGEALESVSDWLENDGAQLVGQEAVTLSTTPAYEDGRLVPRPMSLRVYLARTATGWDVMPGGFARIGRSGDASAIAMQRGGTAADVWIVSDRPVDTSSIQGPAGDAPYCRAKPTVLPSRAADNLFWLGRYTERADGILRMMRAYHMRLTESTDPDAPYLEHLATHMRAIGTDPDEPIPESLLMAIGGATSSAGKVRDQFSTDGWAALSDLSKTAQRFGRTLTSGDDTARAMSVLLRKITGFAGLVHENMYRFTGWRFLSIGRSLERTIAMANLLEALAHADAPEGALDLAVEIGDSVMSHRRRYSVFTSHETVVDLLALDAMNPRSILNQLSELKTHVSYLPNAESDGQLSQLSRAVLQVHTSLAIQTPNTLDTKTLRALRLEVESLSDLIGQTYIH